MTGCVCKLSGYCERHKVNKSSKALELCQTDQRYFDAWEVGRGPMQRRNDFPRKEKKKCGPGHHLKAILAEKGYSAKLSGCGCDAKANKMDVWGPSKCREKIDEIAGWLEQSAKDAGWLERVVVSTPGLRFAARLGIKRLIMQAIENAEQELKGAE